jgi:hypothetical protein
MTEDFAAAVIKLGDQIDRAIGESLGSGLKEMAEHQPWEVESYDDGSSVKLRFYSGGGSPEGPWGTLGLMFTDPDGHETIRDYRATGPRREWDVQPALTAPVSRGGEDDGVSVAGVDVTPPSGASDGLRKSEGGEP